MGTSNKKLIGKYIIKGIITLKTGLRVGGQELGITIGGIDNPVIRNPLTGEPYIPGSSLKGKMRSLMERLLNLDISGNKVKRHECEDSTCRVCRLFGSSSKDGNNLPARIIVRDSFLTPESKERLENMETDLPYTEWKTENALDRVTCKADPRNFERVPAGAEFEFEIIYTVENEEDLMEDLKNIATALELVEDDYLGGNGSRGYGKVEFKIKEIVYKDKDYYLGQGQPKVEKCDMSVEEFKKKVEELVSERKG